jgi:hypothetical protein
VGSTLFVAMLFHKLSLALALKMIVNEGDENNMAK